MQHLYKITTKEALYFCESENAVVVSVYNSELDKFLNKPLMDLIDVCMEKGYSIQKCFINNKD